MATRSFTKEVEIDGHKIIISFNSKRQILELCHNSENVPLISFWVMNNDKLRTDVYSVNKIECVKDYNFSATELKERS